jgi:hypothetical protein
MYCVRQVKLTPAATIAHFLLDGFEKRAFKVYNRYPNLDP